MSCVTIAPRKKGGGFLAFMTTSIMPPAAIVMRSSYDGSHTVVM